MIQITRRAIDKTLEDSFRAKIRNSRTFYLEVESRLKTNQPALYNYIEAGRDLLIQLNQDKSASYLVAGYMAGSRLVFRMIEKQSEIDGTESPIITEEDIQRANDRAEVLAETHQRNPVIKRIEMLVTENPDFAEYLLNLSTTSDPITSRGLRLGAIGTYSAYEQAYARRKIIL